MGLSERLKQYTLDRFQKELKQERIKEMEFIRGSEGNWKGIIRLEGDKKAEISYSSEEKRVAFKLDSDNYEKVANGFSFRDKLTWGLMPNYRDKKAELELAVPCKSNPIFCQLFDNDKKEAARELRERPRVSRKNLPDC